MNKVVTINLGGNAYQLEEGAYDTLRAYLAEAGQKLADDPDKEEIVKDLEQAIGGKCNAYMSAYKNVLTQSEIEAVLAEMGPVEAESGERSERSAANAAPAPKRLYRLHEGRVLFGVCTGIAAYFGVDVALVRLVCIVLTVITGGGFILAYILAVIFIPEAETGAQKAEAFGSMPITAQDLVDKAKEGFDQFKNSDQWSAWKQEMREQRRQWKHEYRAHRRMHNHGYDWQGRPRSFLSELNEFIWSMFGLAVVVFFIWILYHHLPLVHQFLDSAKLIWDNFIHSLSKALSK